MKFRTLLILFIAGTWGIGSWWWYTCKIKGFCGIPDTSHHASTENRSNDTKHDPLAVAGTDSANDTHTTTSAAANRAQDQDTANFSTYDSKDNNTPEEALILANTEATDKPFTEAADTAAIAAITEEDTRTHSVFVDTDEPNETDKTDTEANSTDHTPDTIKDHWKRQTDLVTADETSHDNPNTVLTEEDIAQDEPDIQLENPASSDSPTQPQATTSVAEDADAQTSTSDAEQADKDTASDTKDSDDAENEDAVSDTAKTDADAQMSASDAEQADKDTVSDTKDSDAEQADKDTASDTKDKDIAIEQHTDNTEVDDSNAEQAKTDNTSNLTSTSSNTRQPASQTTSNATQRNPRTNDREFSIEKTSKTFPGSQLQGALLYFPFRSNEPRMSDNVATYFEQIVAYLKKNKRASIKLVGHTDSVGRAASNERLGLERANEIRDLLVKLGASSQQITTASKGETEPLANNRTDEGRRKNRRVELIPAQ
ncbi:MAG: hypothetical protein CR991_00290 [Proteobacteria bacterium]|nr:MAG: hypothetical protein CR991_00290 [Pseudomonadota bacterium]